MVGVGNIVSIGSTGGGGGGGGNIDEINGQVGPVVTLVGTSGVVVSPVAPNIINIGVRRFAASFSDITSGVFTHSLGTLDVVVQIYDDQVPRRAILPDEIVIDNINQASVLFNRPQSGRIIIV